jgi:hypothetical protein
MLKGLRLKYVERGRGENNFHIVVEAFGIVFTFSHLQPPSGYNGWSVIDVDIDKMNLNTIEFGNNLMWLLISKGYIHYLRNKESGDTRLYKYFLVTEGWATRIIDKRLELYAGKPEHRYMIEHNQRLRQLPIHYVLMHYPDFFDYLY